MQAHVHFQASLCRKGVAADVTAEELLPCEKAKTHRYVPTTVDAEPVAQVPREALRPAGGCGRARGLLRNENASSARFTGRSVSLPHLVSTISTPVRHTAV